MSLYSKYLLPTLLDLAMRNREQVRLRQEWIPHARGEVLEIGIGSGLNLPFYSAKVKRVRGVDPSIELGEMARRRSAGMPLQLNSLCNPPKPVFRSKKPASTPWS